MSVRIVQASRGRTSHSSTQLVPPHVVIAGDSERDVRVAQRVLTSVG